MGREYRQGRDPWRAKGDGGTNHKLISPNGASRDEVHPGCDQCRDDRGDGGMTGGEITRASQHDHGARIGQGGHMRCLSR